MIYECRYIYISIKQYVLFVYRNKEIYIWCIDNYFLVYR